jgi:hypothetical protein
MEPLLPLEEAMEKFIRVLNTEIDDPRVLLKTMTNSINCFLKRDRNCELDYIEVNLVIPCI